MKLREREHGADFEVNLTPLIDVVFLLLIFFVLTTTFEKEAQLKVELPTASSAENHKLKDPIEIAIDASGKIQLQDGESWQQRLREESAQPQPAPITLRADRQAPHGTVVEVMDLARQLRLLNFSIITERPQ